MDRPVLVALDIAQGPILRVAFAILMLGMLRWALLSASELSAAYLLTRDRAKFWQRLRMRAAWAIAPSLVLPRIEPQLGAGSRLYHAWLSLLNVVVGLGVVITPIFMAAHANLWQKALGLPWPALPAAWSDGMSLVTLIAAGLLLLGRLYSPVLRRLEPPWAFLKPLVLVLPLATGFFAMHPWWSPLDYHFVMLLHVLSAAAVFVLVPFGRILSAMHTPLVNVLPEAEWDAERPASGQRATARMETAS